MAKAKKSSKMVTVTVAEMSAGGARDIEVKSGSTLRAALLAAGYSNPASLKANLRLNGREANLTAKVKKGDFITLAPQVHGGSR